MSLRSAIDQILVIGGVIIAVLPVAVLEEPWTPLIMVLTGILMIGLGVWRLGHRVLSERRVYIGLRSEVDFFIRLVRRLNAHSVVSDGTMVETLRSEMKESVDRMVMLAGQSGPAILEQMLGEQ